MEKVVSFFYYIPAFFAVADEFTTAGWFSALDMLLWASYLPCIIDFATNREKNINKWLEDKNAVLRIAAVVGYAIVVAFAINIIMYIIGNIAYGRA